ncbi:MAG: hypothetical protein ACFFCF_01190 [Promethearchaeota archaeon]
MKNEEVDDNSLLEGNSVYWKRVPVWVPGALITIIVWLVVLYIILTFFSNCARTATHTCISHRNDIPDMFGVSALLLASTAFWDPIQSRHLE